MWWNRIIASSTTQRPRRMLNNFEFRRLPNCLTVGREINWTGFSRRSESREPLQVGAQNFALKHKAGELAFASQRARVSDSCGKTPRSGRTRTVARPKNMAATPRLTGGPWPSSRVRSPARGSPRPSRAAPAHPAYVLVSDPRGLRRQSAVRYASFCRQPQPGVEPFEREDSGPSTPQVRPRADGPD